MERSRPRAICGLRRSEGLGFHRLARATPGGGDVDVDRLASLLSLGHCGLVAGFPADFGILFRHLRGQGVCHAHRDPQGECCGDSPPAATSIAANHSRASCPAAHLDRPPLAHAPALLTEIRPGWPAWLSHANRPVPTDRRVGSDGIRPPDGGSKLTGITTARHPKVKIVRRPVILRCRCHSPQRSESFHLIGLRASGFAETRRNLPLWRSAIGLLPLAIRDSIFRIRFGLRIPVETVSRGLISRFAD